MSFTNLDFEGRVGQRFYHGPLDGDHLVFRNSGTSSRIVFVLREKNSALYCVMLDDNSALNYAFIDERGRARGQGI